MKSLFIAGLAIIALQSCTKEKLPTPITTLPVTEKSVSAKTPTPGTVIIRCGTPVPGVIIKTQTHPTEAQPLLSYPPTHDKTGTPIYIPGKMELQ